MAPPNSNHWTTDPEYIDLLKFLIERTKEVKSPLSIARLAGEFKENNKSFLTTCGLRYRIQSLRPRIHEMDHIDTETKVRMLFALSAPIDNDFLEELKTQADVVLDDKRKIIEYRKKGGGLELKSANIMARKRDEIMVTNQRIVEFLAQKSMETETPINDEEFVAELKKETGAMENIGYLVKRYKLLKNKIHESKDFDEITKVRMLFVSGASVPYQFFETLQKDAFVEVDEENRITKYRANDGSLSLEGDHSRSAITKKIKTNHNYWKPVTNHFENKNECNEEMSNIIEFITEKCENVDSPIDIWQLAREFNSSCRRSKSLQTLYNRINAYRQDIQLMKHLDTLTKVKQLFGLSVSLNLDYLEELRKEAFVKVDHQNRIIKYMAYDGSLTIPGYLSQSIQMKQRLVEKRSIYHEDNQINTANSSKRVRYSETEQLADYNLNSDDFQMLEVKLEPFRGSLIDDFALIDPEDGIKVISAFSLREPKIEVEKKPIDTEIIAFPIKTEDDFIIPKQEELEEEDVKPDLFF